MKKKRSFASGLTIFLPENPNEISNRLRLLKQEEGVATDKNKKAGELVAIIVKLSQHKSHYQTAHKNNLFNFNLR